MTVESLAMSTVKLLADKVKHFFLDCIVHAGDRVAKCQILNLQILKNLQTRFYLKKTFYSKFIS